MRQIYLCIPTKECKEEKHKSAPPNQWQRAHISYKESETLSGVAVAPTIGGFFLYDSG